MLLMSGFAAKWELGLTQHDSKGCAYFERGISSPCVTLEFAKRSSVCGFRGVDGRTPTVAGSPFTDFEAAWDARINSRRAGPCGRRPSHFSGHGPRSPRWLLSRL